MVAAKQARAPRWEPDFSALFDEGRYAEAAQLYDANAGSSPPLSASFLRARIFLRTDPPRALAMLNGLRPKARSHDAAKHAMLLGEAYAQTGDFDAAREHQEAALALARQLGDAELEAAAGYRIGRRCIMTNDPAAAREAWKIASTGHSEEARLDAATLEAAILSREGRHHDQARVLLELLRAIDPNFTRHMEHRVWATHTLATLARELSLPEAIPEIERQLGGTPWPDDLRVARFQATKALAWAKALQGDYLNAFRFLKQSAAVAPDDAWRTIAFCDRAYLARAIGETRWSRQELLDAEEAAAAAKWHEVKNEESVGLLLLAELFATIDAAKASAYLARFREIGELKDPRLLYRNDDRFTALADYATAIVDIALGSPKLAATRLRKALAVYERMHYDWRAGRCALRLFDVTGDRSFLETAQEKLRNYSSSWLAAELRERRTTPPNDAKLSPMQERVFRYLCKGMTNVEIAAELGRSDFTVANHAKAVLKAFGVSSRSALIAEAMRRELI